MTTRFALPLIITTALVFGAGCKKEQVETTEEVPAAEPTNSAAAVGSVEAPPADEVASYPNEVPQGGTVKLLQSFVVYKAADRSSDVLSRLGVGTLVNLKSSYSNWMKIEWPSGVGKLSPGWIELKSINDSRVAQTTATPTATATTTAAPTATASTTATAEPTATAAPTTTATAEPTATATATTTATAAPSSTIKPGIKLRPRR